MYTYIFYPKIIESQGPGSAKTSEASFTYNDPVDDRDIATVSPF